MENKRQTVLSSLPAVKSLAMRKVNYQEPKNNQILTLKKKLFKLIKKQIKKKLKLSELHIIEDYSGFISM